MDKTAYNRKKRQFKNLQLVGVTDIARMLDWEPKKVGVYMTRGKFPKPVGEVGGRPVWFKEQIEPYVAELKK